MMGRVEFNYPWPVGILGPAHNFCIQVQVVGRSYGRDVEFVFNDKTGKIGQRDDFRVGMGGDDISRIHLPEVIGKVRTVKGHPEDFFQSAAETPVNAIKILFGFLPAGFEKIVGLDADDPLVRDNQAVKMQLCRIAITGKLLREGNDAFRRFVRDVGTAGVRIHIPSFSGLVMSVVHSFFPHRDSVPPRPLNRTPAAPLCR